MMQQAPLMTGPGHRAWPICPGIAMALLALGALSACHSDHVQSALHPAGPAAREVAALWWALFTILSAVFIGTMLLLLISLVLPRRKDGAPPGGETRFIVIAGIVVPAAILITLLILSLRSTIALRLPESNLTIAITGHRWWWHVEYPEHGVVTANEFYIPPASRCA